MLSIKVMMIIIMEIDNYIISLAVVMPHILGPMMSVTLNILTLLVCKFNQYIYQNLRKHMY
jgi:hypothetical protein